MRALTRKVWRDLLTLAAPLGAVAVVAASAIALFITLASMRGFMRDALKEYYATHRFADVFVQLERAPVSLIGTLARIPGVRVAEPRIVYEAILDVPRLEDPAVGRLVSIPDDGAPLLDIPYVRQGRYPRARSRDEVLASEAFVEANRLRPGDSVGVVLGGRWTTLRIVGVAISPEYVYEIRGGEFFPDNRRFGVLWMRQSALADATGLHGAFNNVEIALAPGARAGDVKTQLDTLLARYGSVGAFGRDELPSHRFITDEIRQNRVGSVLLPGILLGVAAFLLNVVLARLLATQRPQIALLKAFGYGTRAIGIHYLEIALAPVGLAALIGVPLGLRLARGLAAVYAHFYRFPTATPPLDRGAITIAVGVAFGAAIVGAANAIRTVLHLHPAEGMRVPAPARFGHDALARIEHWVSFANRVVIRNIVRRPLRAIATTVAIALAFGVVVVVRFAYDAVDRIMEVQFERSERESALITFRDHTSEATVSWLRALPGVTAVDPMLALPVELRHGLATRRVALVAMHPDATLRRVVDADGHAYALPSTGLLLTSRLASILGVRPGDSLTVEVREGRRPRVTMPVTAVANELLGLNAYADIAVVNRLIGESATMSGAAIAVDPRAERTLFTELKRLPALSGVAIRAAMIQSFRSSMAESFRLSLGTAVIFAVIIAFGVVFNGARIALSERSRELASLRVLGFGKGEVTRMLFAEQLLLSALGSLLGVPAGYTLCLLVTRAGDSEMFRLPLVIGRTPYLFATGVVTGATLLSSIAVRRRIRTLDIVACLKTGE